MRSAWGRPIFALFKLSVMDSSIVATRAQRHPVRQRKQITESDADQTITLDAEGWSLARIAERLCFDAETVRQPLKQRGARNGQPNCCPSISGMTRSAKDRVSRATPPRSSRASRPAGPVGKTTSRGCRPKRRPAR